MVEVHWLRPVSVKNMNAVEDSLINIEKRIPAVAEKVKELNSILGTPYSLLIFIVEPKWEHDDSPGFEIISIPERDKFMEETWKKLSRDNSELHDFLKLQTLFVEYNSETGLYSFLVRQGFPIDPDPVALVEFPRLKCVTKEMWDKTMEGR